MVLLDIYTAGAKGTTTPAGTVVTSGCPHPASGLGRFEEQQSWKKHSAVVGGPCHHAESQFLAFNVPVAKEQQPTEFCILK